MPSTVLGDGTDSEYVITPFFVPHFYFACTVGGTNTSTKLSIQALIDDGSDSVLINLKYMDCLSLARHKLPMPKDVVMAVGSGKKDSFSFDEWVLLMIISSDQAWTSCTC